MSDEVKEVVAKVKEKVKKPKKETCQTVPKSEKLKRIAGVLSDLRAKFPGVTIGTLSEPETRARVEYVKHPTGVDLLDINLGGGLPEGKLTVAFGPRSSGKSALGLVALARYLEDHPDKYALFLDSENACDLEWMKLQGVDVDRCIFIKLGTMEDQANQIIYAIDELGDVIGFLLVDSIGSLVPRVEYQGSKKTADKEGIQGFDMNNDSMAVVARKLGQFLRCLNIHISKHKITTFAVAHIYQDLGNPGGGVKMKGGNALEHFAHVKIKLYSMRDQVFEQEIIGLDGEKRKVRTGFWSVMEIEKTRQSGTQGAIVRVPFKFGVGFDGDRALLNSAIGHGVLDKSGSWISFEGEKIGQGIKSSLDRLQAEPQLKEKIRTRLMEVLAQKNTFGQVEETPQEGLDISEG